MGKSTVIRYTCDKCGVHEDVYVKPGSSTRDIAPKGWKSVVHDKYLLCAEHAAQFDQIVTDFILNATKKQEG